MAYTRNPTWQDYDGLVRNSSWPDRRGMVLACGIDPTHPQLTKDTTD